MKKIIAIFTIIVIVNTANAQAKYFTKTGKINFDATAKSSPENIKAVNKATTMVLDSKSGDVQFVSLMKGFEFEKALMQEHFNENYVETTKFPKAEFKGNISNNSTVVYTKDGAYKVKVAGKLTMHGVTKDIETEAVISIKSGKVSASATINALLADYKINIPSMVADKVGKSAAITINCALEVLKK
jgi:polyisoprenoid-binding protein YceI